MRLCNAQCHYCHRTSGWYRCDYTASGWVCDACRHDPLTEPGPYPPADIVQGRRAMQKAQAAVQESERQDEAERRAWWNREVRKAYILAGAAAVAFVFKKLFGL